MVLANIKPKPTVVVVVVVVVIVVIDIVRFEQTPRDNSPQRASADSLRLLQAPGPESQILQVCNKEEP